MLKNDTVLPNTAELYICNAQVIVVMGNKSKRPPTIQTGDAPRTECTPRCTDFTVATQSGPGGEIDW